METLVFVIELSLRLLALLLLGTGSVAGIAGAVLLWTKAQTAKAEAAQKLSGDQRVALDNVITLAVQAAEQLIFTASPELQTEANGKKFQYVLVLAQQAAKNLGIEISETQLRAMVESAVYLLKQEQNYFKR